MRFIAQEVREIMAKLGVPHKSNEMIGRTDRLEAVEGHRPLEGQRPGLHADFAPARCRAEDAAVSARSTRTMASRNRSIHHGCSSICEPAIERGESVHADLPIRNVNRVVGTIVGSEVTQKWGANGLPEDTIHLNFNGSAGQSFGAFMPRGMTIELEGDANDYFGKGLRGGKIIVYPPKAPPSLPEENIIIGNVALYGATAARSYIRGMAGERFGVRNSGVNAVVEAVGDHGCEYMTGGRVVVLGPTGRNFAAGMSGGVAYVLDEAGDFASRCQHAEWSSLEKLDGRRGNRGGLEDDPAPPDLHQAASAPRRCSRTGTNMINRSLSKSCRRITSACFRIHQRSARPQGLSGEEADHGRVRRQHAATSRASAADNC